VGEVGLVRPAELFALVERHQRLRDVDDLGMVQDRERRRKELAVDADEGHVAGGQVQVTRAAFHGVAEQIGSVHPCPGRGRWPALPLLLRAARRRA
jgi:hypothetical protein